MEEEAKYQLYKKGEFSLWYKKVGKPGSFSDSFDYILNQAKRINDSEKLGIHARKGRKKTIIFELTREKLTPKNSKKNLDTNFLLPEMIFQDSLNFPENFSYLQGVSFFNNLNFPEKTTNYFKIKPVKYSSGGKD